MERIRRVLGQRQQKANFAYFIIWLRIGFGLFPKEKTFFFFFLTHESAVLYEGPSEFSVLASIVKITTKLSNVLIANFSSGWGLGLSARPRLQQSQLVLGSRRPSTPSPCLNLNLPDWG